MAGVVGEPEGVELGAERMIDDPRMTIEDHEIEVAPDQLRQPDSSAGSSVQHQRVGASGQRPDRHRSEPEMDRQVRGAADCREIAGPVIAIDAFEKFLEQPCASAHPGADRNLREVGSSESKLFETERRVGHVRHCQLAATGLRDMGRQIGGYEPFQPRVLVWREHGKRPFRLRQDFIAIEDRLILAALEADSCDGKCVADRGVA